MKKAIILTVSCISAMYFTFCLMIGTIISAHVFKSIFLDDGHISIDIPLSLIIIFLVGSLSCWFSFYGQIAKRANKT